MDLGLLILYRYDWSIENQPRIPQVKKSAIFGVLSYICGNRRS
jgi:hypothetical protein